MQRCVIHDDSHRSRVRLCLRARRTGTGESRLASHVLLRTHSVHCADMPAIGAAGVRWVRCVQRVRHWGAALWLGVAVLDRRGSMCGRQLGADSRCGLNSTHASASSPRLQRLIARQALQARCQAVAAEGVTRIVWCCLGIRGASSRSSRRRFTSLTTARRGRGAALAMPHRDAIPPISHRFPTAIPPPFPTTTDHNSNVVALVTTPAAGSPCATPRRQYRDCLSCRPERNFVEGSGVPARDSWHKCTGIGLHCSCRVLRSRY